MSFGDLSTSAGLEKLNEFLADHSFIKGTEASEADKTAANEIGSAPNASKYPHVARWFKTVKGTVEADEDIKEEEAKEAEGDDDDVDLFGSDDEEEDPEAARVREERLAAYHAKKAQKPKTIAKSMVTLDVKGWDDETDMDEMLKHVKSIEMEGLVWGGHKFVPVGFGMNKLQINCVVEDDKVSMDELAELIQEDEDHVQSVDVAAMQKI